MIECPSLRLRNSELFLNFAIERLVQLAKQAFERTSIDGGIDACEEQRADTDSARNGALDSFSNASDEKLVQLTEQALKRTSIDEGMHITSGMDNLRIHLCPALKLYS
jgi:hypothetical protein